MNIKSKTLVSIIAMSSLVACSDSSSLDPLPDLSQANVVNDSNATATDRAASPSLSSDASSVANDLTISDVQVTGNFSADSTVSYQFSVADNGGAGLAVDQLSVALEIAGSGSFTDAYRISLFDLRTSDSNSNVFTARSAPVDLPGGAYTARLVVNPSWQYAFDIAPTDHMHSEPFRFVDEGDFSNNVSSTFEIDVANALVCVEDGFEDNDEIGSAQVIPVGGQINASLCLDNMDLYSIELADQEAATLVFNYTDSETNLNPSTRYVILDNALKPLSEPSVARELSNIVVEASSGGTYHVALFGQRSSYQLTRSATGGIVGFANDFVDTHIFSSDTIAGPQSWLLGEVTLQKLAFTEDKLVNQVVNCGRITTQYGSNSPVAYVTPSHFADIYEFRFLANGDYLIDAEKRSGWGISNDDISNPDWYGNDYPGYAERVSDNNWRYWSNDGLAYVDCTLEVN